jgi:hypothetical protein
MNDSKANLPSNGGPMGRRELAVWLGRALSTDELTLKLVLQLLDVVAFQQGLIQELAKNIPTAHIDGNGNMPEALKELEGGATERILRDLNDLRDQIRPVLTAVEDSCTQLEKMI